jgi:uncharacterized membrane protein YccC
LTAILPMAADQNQLGYRSRSDAVSDDVRAMRRSLRTWVVVCVVWLVGLAVWAVYLGAIAYAFFKIVV